MAELNLVATEDPWGRRRPRAEETVPRFDREFQQEGGEVAERSFLMVTLTWRRPSGRALRRRSAVGGSTRRRLRARGHGRSPSSRLCGETEAQTDIDDDLARLSARLRRTSIEPAAWRTAGLGATVFLLTTRACRTRTTRRRRTTISRVSARSGAMATTKTKTRTTTRKKGIRASAVSAVATT